MRQFRTHARTHARVCTHEACRWLTISRAHFAARFVKRKDDQSDDGDGGGAKLFGIFPAVQLCGGVTASPTVVFAVAAAATFLAVVVMPIILTLPETVTCHADVESYFNVLVPVPEIVKITPPLSCVFWEKKRFIVNGSGFLQFEGTAPEMIMHEIPPLNVSDEYRDYWNLTNTTDVQLGLETWDDPIDETKSQRLNQQSNYIDRSELAEYGWFNNESNVTRGTVVEVRKREVFTFETLGFSIERNDYTESGLPFWSPNITLTLPAEAEDDCSVNGQNYLVLVPPADVATVTPAAVCEGTTHTVVIRGEFFLTVETQVPVVMLEQIQQTWGGVETMRSDDPIAKTSSIIGTVVKDITDCIDVPVLNLSTTSCKEMTIEFDAVGRPLGLYAVLITNPWSVLGGIS
jgi:hypothetical protein